MYQILAMLVPKLGYLRKLSYTFTQTDVPKLSYTWAQTKLCSQNSAGTQSKLCLYLT